MGSLNRATIITAGAHSHRRDHRPAVLDLPQPARFGCAPCVRIESGENMELRTLVRAADRMGTLSNVSFDDAGQDA